MPLTISQYARGLPSLLNLQAGGVGPRELAETIAPSLDLRELLLLNNRVSEPITGQPNPVVGSNDWGTVLRVPAGELWYVWHYFVASGPGAGEAIDLAPAVDLDQTAFLAPVGDYVAATANQNGRAYMRMPLWAGPGSRFGFVVRSLTLQPDVAGALVVTKLRV